MAIFSLTAVRNIRNSNVQATYLCRPHPVTCVHPLVNPRCHLFVGEEPLRGVLHVVRKHRVSVESFDALDDVTMEEILGVFLRRPLNGDFTSQPLRTKGE